jgi:hypothetical protein
MKKTLMVVFLMSLFLTACQADGQPSATCTSEPAETPVAQPPLSLTTVLPVITPTSPTPLDLFKGPYMVFGRTPLEISVIWQDDMGWDYTFEWGIDTAYTNGSVAPLVDDETAIYRVTLSQLEPNHLYHYRIRTKLAQISGSFRTPNIDSDKLTFWVYGDTRSGPEIHDQIANEILRQVKVNPTTDTFMISTGDLMDIAEEASLQANEFSKNTPNIRELQASLPVVNIMGNHDGTLLFKKYFPYPFTDTFDWSFDFGPAHFTVIDQYIDLAEGTRRYSWLENDMASSKKPWKIILLHESGWSAGPHDNNETVQNLIQPLAERYGVDLVIAGHNHYYARAMVQGVTHLTTGGGGAPLYDPERGWPLVVKTIKAYHFLRFSIDGQELTVEVISPEGELLDQFTIVNKE